MTTPATPTPLSMPGAQAGLAAVVPQAPEAPVAGTPSPTVPVVTVDPGQNPAALAPPATAPAATAAAPAADAATPPWGDDANFDPQRAWSLIQNLRQENSDYRNRAQPILDEHERQRRADLDEQTRLREDLTQATAREAAWRQHAVQQTAASMAGRFIDADAAVALVGDLSGFANGNAIDAAGIAARFDQLAADKPHLVAVAAPTAPQGFTPNRGQAHSGNAAPTPAQVANHAASQGDYKQSLAMKAQQLADLRFQ